MTTHTPAPAHEAVLTDDEILTATLYGQSEARMIRNGRAIESALLSKLRAPVADERAASFSPEDCSKEVYERGTYVGLFDIPKHVANELCAGISAATGARVDWHYFGGRVRVLALPAALASAPVAGEALVRYCPGCGSVGPVEEKYRDCCPDGNQARMIPARLAEQCHDTFRIAIKVLLADAAANDSGAPQASEAVAAEALEVARGALMEIADLADVDADDRSVIVNQALTKIARMTAAPRADKEPQ